MTASTNRPPTPAVSGLAGPAPGTRDEAPPPEITRSDIYIAAEPLPWTPDVAAIVAEAMRELALDGAPPELLVVDLTEVPRGAMCGALGNDAHDALGFYGHFAGQEPYIGIQRGLAGATLRAILRHELCHWWQDRMGIGKRVAGEWRMRAEEERTAYRFAEGRMRLIVAKVIEP